MPNKLGYKGDGIRSQMNHIVADGVIECGFMSAWSPPEAFDTYPAENDDVTIEHYYYEPGNAYTGVDGEHVEISRSDSLNGNDELQQA